MVDICSSNVITPELSSIRLFWYSEGMPSDPEAVDLFEQEFQKHVAARVPAPFSPSFKTGAAVSKYARSLESKRATGELTGEEQGTLTRIDSLWERVSQYNEQLKTHKPETPPADHPVYDLKSSQFVASSAEPPALAEIPKISREEADNIISDINKQFEEKVMAKLKNPPPASPNPGSGTNLSDYLAAAYAHAVVQKNAQS